MAPADQPYAEAELREMALHPFGFGVQHQAKVRDRSSNGLPEMAEMTVEPDAIGQG